MTRLHLKQRPAAAAVQALLAAVQRLDVDVDAVVRRASLAPDAAAVLASGWPGIFSDRQLAMVIHECAWALEVQSCRRLNRKPMTRQDFNLFCYCLINCTTLRDAIARGAEFNAALGERAAVLSLRTDGDIAELEMDTARGADDDRGLLPDLVGLSAFARLFCWLIGEDIQPMTMYVRHRQQFGPEITALLTPYPTAYFQPRHLLRFPARYLDRPVIRSYGELVRLLRLFPFDGCTADMESATLAPKIRRLIWAALEQSAPLPSSEELARQLNTSVPTLRRRLNEEATSISQLRDECRHALAIHLLQEPHLDMGKIAERLGYSEPSAFRRAFNAWTGSSPTNYRHTLTADRRCAEPASIRFR